MAAVTDAPDLQARATPAAGDGANDLIVHPGLSFENSVSGRVGARLPECDVPTQPPADLIPTRLRRKSPPLWPEMSELGVVRHFTNLSRQNVGIDTTFYPLGSCTMKYNPRVNETLAALPGFTDLHPLEEPEQCQGTLHIMYEVARMLAELSGFHEVSLQPAAGAHGEFTSLLVVRAALRKRGEGATRRVILIPDTAHGTNPASCTAAGLETRVVKSCRRGLIDLEDLSAKADGSIAGLMITNPNTLG
ncbi:MAG: hypothetical protein HY719_09790, partial [Planctomycetes bacterium]|nr:hypothetical protein [Planctomycetota bacterium]